MCVCALRGERNTQLKRGKINGEHNRKARANFSHSLSLCITVRSRILPVIVAHEKLQNQQRITLTHCAQTPTKKTSTAFVQKAIKRMTEKRSEVREIVRTIFR